MKDENVTNGIIGNDIRVIDLTVGQLKTLISETISKEITKEELKGTEYGIAGIARIFGVSISTANRIKKSGIIEEAITQNGRNILIDVAKAKYLYKTRT